jgi:hypothetical protein
MGIARHPEVEGFEAYSSFHTVKSFDGYREHSIAGAEGIDPESVTRKGESFGDSLGSRQHTNITRYSKTLAD